MNLIRMFSLRREGYGSRHNLRWRDLFDLIALSDDEIDIVASLVRGESYTTKDGFTIRRQDS